MEDGENRRRLGARVYWEGIPRELVDSPENDVDEARIQREAKEKKEAAATRIQAQQRGIQGRKTAADEVVDRQKQEAMKHYTTGWYVVKTNIEVSDSEVLHGREVGTVEEGKRVYVLEVLPHPEFQRIRVKIKSPAGFSSLVGLGSDSGKVWLQKDEEFEKAMKQYTTGWYVVKTNIEVSDSEVLHGKEVGTVEEGKRVYVLEVLPHPEFQRIRAKIKDPAGFSSLVGLGSDSGKVWLQKDEEFEKALESVEKGAAAISEAAATRIQAQQRGIQGRRRAADVRASQDAETDFMPFDGDASSMIDIGLETKPEAIIPRLRLGDSPTTETDEAIIQKAATEQKEAAARRIQAQQRGVQGRRRVAEIRTSREQRQDAADVGAAASTIGTDYGSKSEECVLSVVQLRQPRYKVYDSFRGCNDDGRQHSDIRKTLAKQASVREAQAKALRYDPTETKCVFAFIEELEQQNEELRALHEEDLEELRQEHKEYRLLHEQEKKDMRRLHQDIKRKHDSNLITHREEQEELRQQHDDLRKLHEEEKEDLHKNLASLHQQREDNHHHDVRGIVERALGHEKENQELKARLSESGQKHQHQLDHIVRMQKRVEEVLRQELSIKMAPDDYSEVKELTYLRADRHARTCKDEELILLRDKHAKTEEALSEAQKMESEAYKKAQGHCEVDVAELREALEMRNTELVAGSMARWRYKDEALSKARSKEKEKLWKLMAFLALRYAVEQAARCKEDVRIGLLEDDVHKRVHSWQERVGRFLYKLSGPVRNVRIVFSGWKSIANRAKAEYLKRIPEELVEANAQVRAFDEAHMESMDMIQEHERRLGEVKKKSKAHRLLVGQGMWKISQLYGPQRIVDVAFFDWRLFTERARLNAAEDLLQNVETGVAQASTAHAEELAETKSARELADLRTRARVFCVEGLLQDLESEVVKTRAAHASELSEAKSARQRYEEDSARFNAVEVMLKDVEMERARLFAVEGLLQDLESEVAQAKTAHVEELTEARSRRQSVQEPDRIPTRNNDMRSRRARPSIGVQDGLSQDLATAAHVEELAEGTARELSELRIRARVFCVDGLLEDMEEEVAQTRVGHVEELAAATSARQLAEQAVTRSKEHRLAVAQGMWKISQLYGPQRVVDIAFSDWKVAMERSRTSAAERTSKDLALTLTETRAMYASENERPRDMSRMMEDMNALKERNKEMSKAMAEVHILKEQHLELEEYVTYLEAENTVANATKDMYLQKHSPRHRKEMHLQVRLQDLRWQWSQFGKDCSPACSPRDPFGKTASG